MADGAAVAKEAGNIAFKSGTIVSTTFLGGVVRSMHWVQSSVDWMRRCWLCCGCGDTTSWWICILLLLMRRNPERTSKCCRASLPFTFNTLQGNSKKLWLLTQLLFVWTASNPYISPTEAPTPFLLKRTTFTLLSLLNRMQWWLMKGHMFLLGI